MKLVMAYIQPFMLDKVSDTLREMDVHGVTVIECRGFGRQTHGQKPHYLDEGVDIDFAPKAKVDIVCRDVEASEIVQAIKKAAHTGRYGDGKIFISDIREAVDIRTGRGGEEIL